MLLYGNYSICKKEVVWWTWKVVVIMGVIVFIVQPPVSIWCVSGRNVHRQGHDLKSLVMLHFVTFAYFLPQSLTSHRMFSQKLEQHVTSVIFRKLWILLGLNFVVMSCLSSSCSCSKREKLFLVSLQTLTNQDRDLHKEKRSFLLVTNRARSWGYC